MSSLFGGSPKAPPPAPPPPPAGPTDTEVQTEAANERARLRLRRGRAATILTNPLTASTQSSQGTNSLLGGGG